MDGIQVFMLLVVGLLTYLAVKKKWNQIAVGILLTALIGLTGMSGEALQAINGTAQKANADELYGITGTNLGLALLTGLLAWVARTRARGVFILMLVATLLILRIDAILVDAIRGDLGTQAKAVWNWFWPWIQEQFESISS